MGGGTIATTQVILEKHRRYGESYKPNDFFWGMGIECESYFEMSTRIPISAEFLLKNHKPERYSVDYYTSYKPAQLEATFNKISEQTVPLLLNSHLLTKTNKFLEHETLYKKGAPPNPKFQGKTLFECLRQKNPTLFDRLYEKNFVFDGDSIEIMTQNYYKTSVQQVFSEFTNSRKQFIQALQELFTENQYLSHHGKIDWAKNNYGFAIMATNQSNLAIFNNGTYHINLTLPTQLNEEGRIKDFPLFEKQHRTLIRYIQWLEPLLIGTFGSPDILSTINPDLYTRGSQRCAMSRYIGIGTYDTTKMEKGKLLSVPVYSLRSKWYEEYHKTSGYNSLNEVGLDINFNKHWNHGIEIRFFDWFPEGRLLGLLRFLVYVMDVSLDEGDVPDPLGSSVWTDWMVRVMKKGTAAGCTEKEAALFTTLFCVDCKPEKDLSIVFADLYHKLAKKWKGKGKASTLFLSDESKPLIPLVVPPPTTPRVNQSFFNWLWNWCQPVPPFRNNSAK